MPLNEGEIKMLDLIARLVSGNPNICAYSNRVTEESGLLKTEADKYLSKLEGLEYFKCGPKSAGINYTMINLTTEGLENSNWSEGTVTIVKNNS